MIGCWNHHEDVARPDALREGAKADLFAATLRDATRHCVEASKLIRLAEDSPPNVSDVEASSNLKQGIS